MYIFRNNNPEELYQINQMIDEEEQYLCNNVKKQVSEIDCLLTKRKMERANNNLKPVESQPTRTSSNLSLQSNHDKYKNINILKKNKTNFPVEPPIEKKIYPSIISFAIYHTHKYMKERMINYTKIEKIGRAHV